MSGKTTRAANGGGSIRKRSDGRWEARYSLGFDPKTGKQIQKSIYGKTQKEVRQKLNKINTEIDEGTYFEPSKMKLSVWLEEWLRDYIGNVKNSTVKSYQDHVRLNITPYIGDIALNKLSTAHVEKMYNELLREKGLSPKSIKNVHGVLHRALDQAIKMGYIKNNPLNAVMLPRIEKAQIKPLGDDALVAFLKEIRGNPCELVFYVTVFAGLRQGEILGLTWDCVDFERGTILVNNHHGKLKGKNEYAFTSLKNDRPRVLNVAEAVIDALKKQKAQQGRWAKTFGETWRNPDNLVFTTEAGRYLCNHTVYLAFKKVVKKLGYENVRFHDLRHTFAVNSLKAGDDIKTVQENLGHHTAAFTLGIYAHVSSGMKRESAKRMENFIQTLV